jgi:dihydrofolate reductase
MSRSGANLVQFLGDVAWNREKNVPIASYIARKRSVTPGESMRKIVVLEFLSLDGVMQAPGGPEEDTSSGFRYGGWTVPYSDEFMGGVMGKQMSGPFDLLLGRKTYEIFAAYWPNASPADQPFAAPLNNATKYVATRTLKNLSWQNSRVIAGDLVAEIKKLKAQDGPPLQVYGSGNLVQTLMQYDLVDEFWLKIFPVTLGSGKRLFADGTIPAAFRLLGSEVTPKGVIVASFARDGDVKTGSFV